MVRTLIVLPHVSSRGGLCESTCSLPPFPAGNVRNEMFRLRVLGRDYGLGLYPSSYRAMNFSPPYNTSLFPTSLSEVDVAAAVAGLNTNASTWPMRPPQPARRLDSSSLPDLKWGPPPEARQRMSPLARTIRNHMFGVGSTGASNAWVVRRVCVTLEVF